MGNCQSFLTGDEPSFPFLFSVDSFRNSASSFDGSLVLEKLQISADASATPAERAKILQAISELSIKLPDDLVLYLVAELQSHQLLLNILEEMKDTDNDMILWTFIVFKNILRENTVHMIIEQEEFFQLIEYLMTTPRSDILLEILFCFENIAFCEETKSIISKRFLSKICSSLEFSQNSIIIHTIVRLILKLLSQERQQRIAIASLYPLLDLYTPKHKFATSTLLYDISCILTDLASNEIVAGQMLQANVFPKLVAVVNDRKHLPTTWKASTCILLLSSYSQYHSLIDQRVLISLFEAFITSHNQTANSIGMDSLLQYLEIPHNAIYLLHALPPPSPLHYSLNLHDETTTTTTNTNTTITHTMILPDIHTNENNNNDDDDDINNNEDNNDDDDEEDDSGSRVVVGASLNSSNNNNDGVGFRNIQHLDKVGEFLLSDCLDLQLHALSIFKSLAKYFPKLKCEQLKNSDVYLLFEKYFIDIIRTFSTGHQAQQIAMQIFNDVSNASEFQQLILQKDILHQIISALNSDDALVKTQAVSTLQNLIHVDTHRRAIARSSVVLGNLLFLTRDHYDVPSLILPALHVIVELAKCEENRQRVVEAGVLEPLFAMALVDLPVCDALDLVSCYVFAPVCVSRTCSLTIFSLSKKKMYANQLVKVGIHLLLTELLNCKHNETIMFACGAIAKLAALNDTVKLQLLDQNILSQLIDLLHLNNTDLDRSATAAIGCLVMHPDFKHRNTLVTCDILPLFVNLMRSCDSQVRQRSVNILRVLAIDDKNRLPIVRTPNILPQLKILARHPELDRIVDDTTALITTLSRNRDAFTELEKERLVRRTRLTLASSRFV